MLFEYCYHCHCWSVANDMPLYISLEFDEEKKFEWEYNSALYPRLEFDFFLHRYNVTLQK